MIPCKGIGINDYIAIGRAKVIVNHTDDDYPVKADNPKKEIERLHKAQEVAKTELQKLHDKTLETVGPDDALIFEMHQMMLDDVEFTEMIENEINNNSSSAEHAVIVARDNFSSMLLALNDDYMSQRADDVKDISGRLLDCLSNADSKAEGEEESDVPLIICAEDLLPSQVVSMDLDSVKAIALGKGSKNSHASILANSFGFASVVNLGDVFTNAAVNGCVVIVDGKKGEVVINPDKETLLEAKQLEIAQKKHLAHLQELKGQKAITKDGKEVELAANIGGPEDIPGVIENDADGIGLFRSEFIYLGVDDYPTEEEQFVIYKNVLEKMEGKRVVVRTLDIGSDKSADYFKLDEEENPALGLRAIRLCFSRDGLLGTQLRALFRASVYGRLAIMFPMIANVWEVERLIEICNQVKADLKSEGVKYDDNVEIGIMIETPAAALISDQLAPLVDFFSVGTNDLTQYTLACDRQNPNLIPFCDTHHDAVLSLIERAANAAHENDAWIGICGELANDSALTEQFLRMGIDELSMASSHILKIKDIVLNIDLSKKEKPTTTEIIVDDVLKK
ncbi:MAG: phosphoenolpyruvate--protein phosphotransferase [Coriobacteriia bacterium]|nr:phosphoenolpyruvate--protein phosphotransferase [Coriobacteriia bacterium]